MLDVGAIYREIAGTEPDPVIITRIRRIGRLLKLTETDSGWILLAVLAAHATSAATNLQAASTLAASLGVAAGNVNRSGEALREATETATSTIVAAVDQAKPALALAFDTAAGKARSSIGETQDHLVQAIEAIGSKTGKSIAAQIDAAMWQSSTVFENEARQTVTHMERTIVNAVASATETLQTSATELRDGANAARDATVEEWRSKTLTAITKVMEERVKIDATKARHTAFQTGSAIVAVLLFMITIICYATFYTVHRTIWNDGYKTGLTAAALHHDQQKVRASWANTHDGKLAYQLYRAGSIPKLANCTAPGWKIGKSSPVCFPYMKGKAVYGWAIGP